MKIPNIHSTIHELQLLMIEIVEINTIYKALLALGAGAALGVERELKDKAADKTAEMKDKASDKSAEIKANAEAKTNESVAAKVQEQAQKYYDQAMEAVKKKDFSAAGEAHAVASPGETSPALQ